MLARIVERSLYASLGLLWVVCRADEEGSGSGRGSSDEPPLSTEAIANITATAAALAVIGSALCYLMMCYNKDERLQRVRMAQERNRQITKQIEAAKQRKRAQQLATGNRLETSAEEERRAAGSLLFSQAHHSHEDRGSRDRLVSDSTPSKPTT